MLIGCDCNVEADLGNGTWIDERQHTDIPGFEDASIAGDRTRLHGSAKRNHLVVFGCASEIFGFRGNDELITVADGVPCVRPVRQHGGKGDDVLKGDVDADLLFGGAGFDRAFGSFGNDRCRAERKQDCER